MSVQKKHNFPTEGSYYKRFKFQVMQQSLKFGIVHDVSADVMLALAWHHLERSALAGDGSHSTDQPLGRG
jgi:hypothetical protein